MKAQTVIGALVEVPGWLQAAYKLGGSQLSLSIPPKSVVVVQLR